MLGDYVLYLVSQLVLSLGLVMLAPNLWVTVAEDQPAVQDSGPQWTLPSYLCISSQMGGHCEGHLTVWGHSLQTP